MTLSEGSLADGIFSLWDQAITWNTTDFLQTGPLGTYFSEITKY